MGGGWLLWLDAYGSRDAERFWASSRSLYGEAHVDRCWPKCYTLDAMVTSLAIVIIEAYELRVSDFFKKDVRSSTDSKSVKAQIGPTSLLTFRPY